MAGKAAQQAAIAISEKKSAAKKSSAVKKSRAQTTAAKKSPAKKSAAKTTVKKTAAKPSTAQKSAAKKSAAKKSNASKSPAKKSTAKRATKYGKDVGTRVGQELDAMKHGKLRSGSGQKVTNPKQAIAIALSEKRREGSKVPPNPNEK